MGSQAPNFDCTVPVGKLWVRQTERTTSFDPWDPKNGRIPYIYVRLLPCALEGENGATSIVCPESPSLYIVNCKAVLESQEIDLSKLFSEYTTKC